MAGRKSKYSYERDNYLEYKTWSVALYIRLSQEDEDNGKDKQESNSVTSQKNLLNEFIEEHEDFKVYNTYIDDGFTGTDFNRPAFQRLLEDIKDGKIDTIIVKDLSRLGRNYIEVGNYIEQIFPLFNIRFIAINDGVDSFKKPESVNTILIPFKNLINDEYARDTSIKIRTSLNSKKKKGEFVGAFSPYGYLKDPKDKHRLVIDESVKEVVQNIFDWYVNKGWGKIAICHKLNDMGILNPTGHKKLELRQNYQNYETQNDNYVWTPSTIRNILNNEVYIGNTIQGKRKTKSYKIHKVETVPIEERIKVEHTHEPIIDKEIFEKAQELNKKDIKISQKTKELSIWAGLLKCNDCKRAMNKKSSTNKSGKTYEYYICSTYRKKSNKLCTKHTIKVDILESVILKVINLHIRLFLNVEQIIYETKRDLYENNKDITLNKIILEKEKEIIKLSRFKKNLYEDWKNGDITKEEYIDYKQKYDEDIKKTKQNIEKLYYEKKQIKNQEEEKSKWLEEFKERKYITNLSRDITLELINCIYIHEDGNITIKFNFADEFKGD